MSRASDCKVSARANTGQLRPLESRLKVVGRTLGTMLLTIAGAAPSAWAQALPDLSLEDLMKLDAGQVFGAAERLQPVTEAPASVSFITAAEIARYGYRTLADVLRAVRGMYVTNDRNFSFVGTRAIWAAWNRSSTPTAPRGSRRSTYRTRSS